MQKKGGKGEKKSKSLLIPEYLGINFENMVTNDGIPSKGTFIKKAKQSQIPNYEMTKFYTVTKRSFGDVDVVMSAEIDCIDHKILTTNGQDPNPIKKYVEIKLVIDPDIHYNNGIHFYNRMSKIWAQSFILGIEDIIFGFRDYSNNLVKVDRKQTEHLWNPDYLKLNNLELEQWNPNELNGFFQHILQWIYNVVTEDEKTCEPPNDMLVIWKLDHQLEDNKVVLKKTYEKKGIVSPQFVDWRNSIKNK